MERTKLIGCIIILLLCFMAGFFCCYKWFPRVVEMPYEKIVTKVIEKPIEVPVQIKGDTIIKYVEKALPSDSDVVIEESKPKVSLSYNGELYQFQTLNKEQHKFENGQLKISTEQQSVLDVTPIVNRELAIQAKELRESSEKTENRLKRQRDTVVGITLTGLLYSKLK